jgi:uncharacterized membrane protein YcfT
MSKTKRLDWVDSAKGISILLVLMMYAAYSVGEATNTTGFMHYLIGFATPFRMPEFFLISGLFLSMVIGRTWSAYLDRRFVHYLYFYAIWATILIVVKVGIFSFDPIGAISKLGWATLQPYSMLWFIYVLAFFSLAAKIAYSLKIPHWAMLVGAAILQIAPVQTPSYAFNQFSEYLVFFYAGYVFAPYIFELMSWFEKRIFLALGALLAFLVINGALVFLPSHNASPTGFNMGIAGFPVIRLILAFAGSLAVCLSAALLSKIKIMNWLKWLGAHSIIIFLGFSLPLTISREILLKLNLINNTGHLTLIVMLIAIISPIILYKIINITGYGKFLFERPAWAHIPGTSGSLSPKIKLNKAPAE